MTDKAMGPGAGDAGGPSEKATRSRSDLSGNHLRIKEPTEFWLHVRADGSELRFAHEPTDVRSLRVENDRDRTRQMGRGDAHLHRRERRSRPRNHNGQTARSRMEAARREQRQLDRMASIERPQGCAGQKETQRWLRALGTKEVIINDTKLKRRSA
jgi:hypothetical protein